MYTYITYVTNTHALNCTPSSLFMMCQPPCRSRRGPRLSCANAENSHLDAESDRSVGIFFVYLQRSTWKSFGYGIVPRNSENHFLTDLEEAANFENSENWTEDWIGQPRSSQPEEEFQDSGDSGEPGAGPEEGFERI